MKYRPLRWSRTKWVALEPGAFRTFAGAAFAAWLAFFGQREPYRFAVGRAVDGDFFEVMLICK